MELHTKRVFRFAVEFIYSLANVEWIVHAAVEAVADHWLG